jgi:TonB family protein
MSVAGFSTRVDATCDKYRWYMSLANDLSHEADVYRDEGDDEMAAIEEKEAKHERDMAEDEVSTCDDPDINPPPPPSVAPPWESRYNGDRDGALQMLLDLGKDHERGLSVSNPWEWNRRRAILKHSLLKFGLPFVAPELYGSAAFHNGVATIVRLNQKVARERRRLAAAAAAREAILHPKPRCAEPNKDAAIVGAGADAEYPDSAREQGAVGTTQVRVSLDAAGRVEDVTVYKSSGNPELDKSALVAAAATHYSAQRVNCVSQAGSFLYRVDFTGQ